MKVYSSESHTMTGLVDSLHLISEGESKDSYQDFSSRPDIQLSKLLDEDVKDMIGARR